MKGNESALTGVFAPADMPEQRYHALPHTSRSDLNLVLRSPQHYRQSKGFPEKATPAMILGSAIHQQVLEPERGDIAVVPETINRRTKVGREEYATWMEEHAGEIVLSQADAHTVKEIVKAVHSVPAAKALLLDDTEREYSYFHRDRLTKLLCRNRNDAGNPETGMLSDLKSTADCTSFGTSIFKFRYHMQAAVYLDWTNETLRQIDMEPRYDKFSFVAVEKTPPYGILAGVLDAEDIERGRQAYQRAMRRLSWCLENDRWPGYSAVVQGISLPGWARRQHDEEMGEL